MTVINQSGGVPATPIARTWRFAMYALGALMCLTGPIFIVSGVVGEHGVGRMIVVAVGVLTSVFLIPLGVGMTSVMSEDHRGSVRLAEVGVPASAEVMAMKHTSYDGEDRVALTLRFAGPGITPFQATYHCANDRTLGVGDRLPAIVDPATNLYAIPNRR